MKHSILISLKSGLKYVKDHPQLFFTLVLLVVIPVAFLFSGQQFLDASRDNQSRLEYDRIGLLHDSFLSIIRVSKIDLDIIQNEIDDIVSLNPDIVVFRVSEKIDSNYVPIVALNRDIVGTKEEDVQAYDLAYVNPNDSSIQTVDVNGDRFLRSVRLLKYNSREFVILTVMSRANTDALFESHIQKAYIWLVILLAIILWLLVRHVRLIDYSYLYKETKKANEMKDLFTNMIAHELRAPLTAMRGYASMIMENENVEQTVKDQAKNIESSSGRLVLIVNDLLDVARIQSGKLSIKKENINISNVVKSVGESMSPLATKKGIELDYDHIPFNIEIFSDEKRLHQVITNLFSNAIKYTQQGSIEVSLKDNKDRVEIRVKDTGMGISAKDQKKLFAPFFRVANDDVSSITGTGLGMWITKQLIELMGGSIGVESIEDVGTHIVVTLPRV